MCRLVESCIPHGVAGAGREIHHITLLQRDRTKAGDLPVLASSDLHHDDVVVIGVFRQGGHCRWAEVGVGLNGVVELGLQSRYRARPVEATSVAGLA